jgi:hypothetical protein
VHLMERRRSSRVLVEYPVVVQRLSEPEVALFGVSQNVSLTGVRFFTEMVLTVGSNVQMNLILSNKDRASAQGTIVRIDEEDRGRFGVAVHCRAPFVGSAIPELESGC